MSLSIQEHLEKLGEVIQKEDFLLNRGLGNEVGYYIFDYDPKDELIVRDYINDISGTSVGDNYEVKVYNLYVIMLEYLEKRGFTEKAIKMEERRGLQKLVESIGRLLKMDLPEEENVFFEYVDAHTPEKSVVFLTGIGELYPLIRAHSILNKMHQVFDRVPVVMMYPGEYDELSLTILNTNKDDNYYRAFRI
ncbi:TPA: DUF1788 domain-containing protein [Enterococcus faecium]|uniref:DUF1788 domain-containing protein n=1 Tax=Enterococcus TaxID=1350 RepID=UPI0002A33C21|nr:MULTISPECIES: DUF1788 domain-containing protein [Enterococcus]EGP4754538.1 DUF1788 domain-containing protein [Enterococcus faecium]EGP4757179.1 DUF1788 domain-containing protein [Enterococcus faecium]EGP5096498.1 DUF1788 domain-containing protein [Enterococcus faecium]EGP5122184.1 DUF1788 domain-containing protein [Enterococcus faecium]EGP5213169.1 DUF1788 domain-containing protein [Enterococcus faecium]